VKVLESGIPCVIVSRETAGFQGRGDAGRELLTHISTASAQTGAALDQSVASSASGEDITMYHRSQSLRHERP